MTERELWNTIWRALRMIEKAIAKHHGFGEFRDTIPTRRDNVRGNDQNIGGSDEEQYNEDLPSLQDRKARI